MHFVRLRVCNFAYPQGTKEPLYYRAHICKVNTIIIASLMHGEGYTNGEQISFSAAKRITSDNKENLIKSLYGVAEIKNIFYKRCKTISRYLECFN